MGIPLGSQTKCYEINLVVIFAAFVTGLSSLVVNASSVKVGYLWEHPRLENVHSSEVVMNKEHSGSILRLICDITPPLPKDGEHWDKRDEIVKWYKTAPKAEPVKSVHYWSDDMSKTAISFSNITLDTLGTYSCIYGDISASIDVLGGEVTCNVILFGSGLWLHKLMLINLILCPMKAHRVTYYNNFVSVLLSQCSTFE